MNPKPKINPQVYLDAAELVATGCTPFACNAIKASGVLGRSKELDAFKEYFHPEKRHPLGAWFDYPPTVRSQNERILALCFMHQIAKDL